MSVEMCLARRRITLLYRGLSRGLPVTYAEKDTIRRLSPRLEQTILSLGEHERSRTLLVVVRHMIDPCAHGIAPRLHISHCRTGAAHAQNVLIGLRVCRATC